MRCALYARVSTDQQNCDRQLTELRDYVHARQWATFREYIDTGVSGTKRQRPALDQLMRDARQRKFDVVLVWAFDRFARSVSHLVDAAAEFKGLGIQIVSYTQQIDTTTPYGEMVFTVLAAVAQLEAAIIRERVNSGIKAARHKGIRLGRPSVITDSLKSELNALRNQGLSIRAIEAKTGINRETIRRYTTPSTV